MKQHTTGQLASQTSIDGGGDRQGSRGFILITVLASLIVTAMLVSVVIRSLFAEQDQIRADRFRMQAMWLAESALERASARLSVDAAYKGETWKAPADELDGRHWGLIHISVEPISDQREKRRVRADVRFPDSSHSGVHLRKEWTLVLPAR